VLGESHPKELQNIPLADNIVGRRTWDVSESRCNQLNGELEIALLTLQVDEITDVVKDAHLITYVQYVLENDITENFCFADLLIVELHHWKCSL
jgi:hypothetical protein